MPRRRCSRKEAPLPPDGPFVPSSGRPPRRSPCRLPAASSPVDGSPAGAGAGAAGAGGIPGFGTSGAPAGSGRLVFLERRGSDPLGLDPHRRPLRLEGSFDHASPLLAGLDPVVVTRHRSHSGGVRRPPRRRSACCANEPSRTAPRSVPCHPMRCPRSPQEDSQVDEGASHVSPRPEFRASGAAVIGSTATARTVPEVVGNVGHV